MTYTVFPEGSTSSTLIVKNYFIFKELFLKIREGNLDFTTVTVNLLPICFTKVR